MKTHQFILSARWFLVCFLWAVSAEFTASHADSSRAQSEIEGIVQRIKDRYGLHLFYQNIPEADPRDILYASATPRDYQVLLPYMQLIEEEINKYPASYFRKTRVRGIYFVKKLFLRKKPVEGFYNHTFRVIFLDFQRSRSHPISLKHNFHHELYHMIALNSPDYTPGNDPEWEQLNEPDFHYGPYKVSPEKSNPINPFAPARLGFITDYAMSDIEEDKAEIYAGLFVVSQHQLLEQWMVKDIHLRSKILKMKEFLKQGCSDINDEYWEDIILKGK